MTPLTWYGIAAAAAIGAALTAVAWARHRTARKQAAQAAAKARLANLRVHGELAIHGEETLFLRLLVDHPELYTDQPSEGV